MCKFFYQFIRLNVYLFALFYTEPVFRLVSKIFLKWRFICNVAYKLFLYEIFTEEESAPFVIVFIDYVFIRFKQEKLHSKLRWKCLRFYKAVARRGVLTIIVPINKIMKVL